VRKFLPLYLLIYLTLPLIVKASGDPFVEEVKVVHGETVNLSFRVSSVFNKELMEAIDSSIATSFTYLVKVHRQRAFFPDKKLKVIKYNHTVKYDSLKKEYVVTMGRSDVGLGSDIIVRTADVEEMKRLMVTTEGLEFTPDEPFKSGSKYSVLVKAEIDVLHLPLSFILDYMLFFIKLGDVETDWYRYEFTY